MDYLLPNIYCGHNVAEPNKYYEIDLVKQWLNLSAGTTLDT